MMDIDKLIRDAMDDEDKAWFDSLGEPSLPMQVIESFKTQSKWIILWSIPVVFVMLGFFVLSVVRILGTDDPGAGHALVDARGCAVLRDRDDQDLVLDGDPEVRARPRAETSRDAGDEAEPAA